MPEIRGSATPVSSGSDPEHATVAWGVTYRERPARRTGLDWSKITRPEPDPAPAGISAGISSAELRANSADEFAGNAIPTEIAAPPAPRPAPAPAAARSPRPRGAGTRPRRDGERVRALVAEGVRAGMTRAQLSDHAGVTTARVDRVLRQLDLRATPAPRGWAAIKARGETPPSARETAPAPVLPTELPRAPHPAEHDRTATAVLAMRGAGVSRTIISAALGLPTTRVAEVLAEHRLCTVLPAHHCPQERTP